VPGNSFLALALEKANASVEPPPLVREPFTNSLAMKLIWVAPGQFEMGSPDSDADASADEKPRHRVKLTKGYYLAADLVTQTQYKELMGANSSGFAGDDLPVEFVSWNDAQEFCRRLSSKEGRAYRLPTEAEWEYACRAGSTTKYQFGDNFAQLPGYAWFDKNAGGATHGVGLKKPNAWGLHDMHGNLWQWCQDWYDPAYYQRSPVADPSNATASKFRVIRGGSWINAASFCRSASRYYLRPSDRDFSVGFRVAAEPAP
jgi:formylglycine-generating enzyme required for sulfatase activity